MSETPPNAQPTSHPSGIGTGILITICGITSIQLGGVVAKGLFAHADPMAVAFGRLFIASVILLAVMRPKFWRWSASAWRNVIFLAITLAAMNSFIYLAIDRIPIGVAVTLEFVGPLVLSLIQARRWLDVLWAVLAAAGVVLLAGGVSGDASLVGVMLALGAGAAWACYIIANARVGRRLPSSKGLSMAMLLSTLMVMPFGIGGVGPFFADPILFIPLTAAAILSSALGYAIETAAIRRVPMRAFSTLMALEPAAAAILAFLILHEALGVGDVLGLLLVSGASAGVTWGLRRKAAPPAPPQQ